MFELWARRRPIEGRGFPYEFILNFEKEEYKYTIIDYLDKEISSKVGLEIIEGAKLEKDIYISKIFVNYEHYGYAIIADEIIGKKQKELSNILKTYFEHLLEM